MLFLQHALTIKTYLVYSVNSESVELVPGKTSHTKVQLRTVALSIP